MPAEIMNSRETSAYLGLSVRTLERMAEVGEGPPRLQLTVRRIAYRLADVDAWLASRCRRKKPCDAPVRAVLGELPTVSPFPAARTATRFIGRTDRGADVAQQSESSGKVCG